MVKIGLFMAVPLHYGAGCAEYFMNLAKYMHEKGALAELITLDDAFFNRISHPIQIYHRLDIFKLTEKMVLESKDDTISYLKPVNWRILSLKMLKKNLKEFDVLYVKNEILDLMILKLIGIKNLPPIIVGVHTPLYYPQPKILQDYVHNFLYTGFFYKFLIKGVSLVHLSNKTAYEMVKRIFNVPAEFIYYPYSPDIIKNYGSTEKSGILIDQNKYNILSLGRMTEQKGIASLVSIIEKLSSMNISEKVMIHIFGDGSLSNMVEESSKKYPYVKYYGYVEHKFVPEILAKMDLLVTTSKYETLPYNVLEAQSMGLPVIAYDIAGPNDIIKNAETGFIVENEDEFIERIEELALSHTIFNSDVIRQNIISKFSPEVINNKLHEMFIKVVNND